MKIALAQVQFALGDFDQNCKQVLNILKSTGDKADLIVFPEGGLWGYPPKDFLYQDTYFEIQKQKFQQINKQLKKGVQLLLPAFVKNKNNLQNGVFLFEKSKKPIFFPKEFLPDQGVFFESRYFKKGDATKNFFNWKNKKIQILICEDLWQVVPDKTVDLLITVNASPYTDQKQIKRLKKMKDLAKKYNCPVIYLNRIGAQDSLIFDGGSFALNQQGELTWQGKFFKPDFKIFNPLKQKKKSHSSSSKLFLNLQEQRRQALILGIKSFFSQTGFSKAVLGLSGGIDSALVAYLAVQALGNKNVKTYFLPSTHTQKISHEIVQQLALKLNIQVVEKNINNLFNTVSKWFFGEKTISNPLSLQNIQSRLRALSLMIEANESSSLLLSTGNKSEIATGYSTLYGDLAGALCPIGDLLKTEVYDLVHFINKSQKIFPKALLLREPSAELAPNQKDQDDLPPYDELDSLLNNILKNQKPKSLKEKELAKLIQKQEFKRAQAPFILKVSERDFGESWKKPIAHKFPI